MTQAAPGLRVISWNVNGIRSVARKGFLDWFAREQPFALGLQETRAELSQFPVELTSSKTHSLHAVSAHRKGYSGAAILSQLPPVKVHTTLQQKEFDLEGRMVACEYDPFILYSVYFPKGSGTARDNSRVPYKLAFYDAVFAHALKLRRQTGKPLIIMGDFNTAHGELDLAHPRANVKNSGFLPEERNDLTRLLNKGFVDTFRALHPTTVRYSWWRNWPGMRERNVGWRIDAVWVSKELMPHVKEAFILTDVLGSDHCPVGITLAL